MDRLPFALREDLGRAVSRRAPRVLLLPGPGHSCLLVGGEFGGSQCEPSVAVARRGLSVAVGDEVARRRFVVVAPAGVTEVRLERRGRAVARSPVQAGVAVVEARRPDTLVIGDHRRDVRDG